MPTRRIVLRRATLRDLPTLVRHRRGMFVGMGVGSEAERDEAGEVYARWVRDLVKARRFAAFIAVAPGGQPVASGAVWLRERQPAPARLGPYLPYLMSMYTDPAWRGKGIARRIVAASIAWCRTRGYHGMSLHAAPKARRLYEGLGWTRTREYSITW